MRKYRWPLDIIANRPDLQALHHRELRLTGAVFYCPGRIAIPAGETVAVNEPCILLLRERDGSLVLAASSPEHRKMGLQVTFSASLRGEGTAPIAAGGTRIILELPGGPLAGSSVVRELRLSK